MSLPLIWQKPGVQAIAPMCQNLASVLKKTVIVVTCTLSSCNFLEIKNPKVNTYNGKDCQLELSFHPLTDTSTGVDLRFTNKSNQNMCINNNLQFNYNETHALQLNYGVNLVNEKEHAERRTTLSPGQTFTLHNNLAFGIAVHLENVHIGRFNAAYLGYGLNEDSTNVFDSAHLQKFDFYF